MLTVTNISCLLECSTTILDPLTKLTKKQKLIKLNVEITYTRITVISKNKSIQMIGLQILLFTRNIAKLCNRDHYACRSKTVGESWNSTTFNLNLKLYLET